ncbi:Lrp/AsnC family transcriptional regulator [Streptomyces sp. NPDC018057]|uniref:Lrp/AsnC family transcriptional regulator n=1 Tax=unclassified Streptomyces TaxID=2593676 RepID=UPI0037BA9DF9
MRNVRQHLDETDQRIAAALIASPRASWRAVATCLGLSERTVVRRAGPLYADGTLRATAERNPIRFPDLVPMALRIRCRPDRIRAVASTLARRADTLWVDILGGGDEISTIVSLDGPEARNRLLLRDLPATAAVHGWTSHTVLRVFPASLNWGARLLDEEETARLGVRPFPLSSPPPEPLPAADLALTGALTEDARADYATLARRTGTTARTVRRRLEALVDDGTVRLVTETDLALLGLRTKAQLWLSVAPSALQAAGERLSREPAVRFTAATTGPANLLVMVTTTGLDALYRFLTDTIGAMQHVTAIETTPVLATAKRTGLTRPGF